MSQASRFGCPVHISIPVLPQRPTWTDDGVLSTEISSPVIAVDTIMAVWNRWADRVENIFRMMNESSNLLDVSVDDYIGWISRISNHPPRPTMSPTDEARESIMGIPRVPFMVAHSRFEAYADELAETHDLMARRLSQCKPRPDEAQDMVICDLEVLDFSKMSLSAATSTRAQVKSIFTAMLGPGRSFHKAANNTGCQRTPISGSNAMEIDRAQEGDMISYQRPAQSETGISLVQESQHFGERPSRQWVQEFLTTVQEINREIEDEDYDELTMQPLDIKDQDMEG